MTALAGGLGGLSGGVGEAPRRVCYAHSGARVDPPAMAIVVVIPGVGLLSIAGVLPAGGYLAR